MSPSPGAQKSGPSPHTHPSPKPPAAPTAGGMDESGQSALPARGTHTGRGWGRAVGAVLRAPAGLTCVGLPLVPGSARAQKGTGPALRAGA